MKVLLDNCVPRPFLRHLPGHEVLHCSHVGWERLSNGRLLAAAESAGFQVVVTVDQGIRFQQNMTGRQIAIVCLEVMRNDLPTLIPLADPVLRALDEIQPGEIAIIRAS